MLAHRDSGNVTFALDPLLGFTEHENSRKTPTLRPTVRTAAIVQALGGSVRTLEEVTCGWCHLKGVSTYLSVSSPQIEGGTATVIATLVQNTQSERTPTYYESTRVTLTKTEAGWVVSKEEQLGIS